MIDPHDASIPEDLRSALHDEPPEKRRHVARLWSLLDEARDDLPVQPLLDDAWAGVRAATEDAHTASGDASARGRQVQDRPSRRRARRGRGVLGTAAWVGAACAMLVIGLWWIYRPVSVTTMPGEQRTVRLPDGSTAELNSATSLRYTRGFRGRPFGDARRRVTLQGEAFFQVVEGVAPFVVDTPDGWIEVVGTAFNVHARMGPSERGTEVTVLEGHVVLRGRTTEEEVVLSGEGASARVGPRGAPEPLQRNDSRLEHALAWRQRGFAVVDRPLNAVLNEVERRYAVEIAPREGIDLSDPMNLFYLRGAAPDTILRDICLYHDCIYRETSRGFALAPRPPSNGPASPPADRN